MSGFGDFYMGCLLAVAESVVAVAIEVRIALGLGRTPGSGPVAMIARDFEAPGSHRRTYLAVCALILAMFQFFPLSQERLFGGSSPPNHISGAAVIVAEIVFAVYIWLGTRPAEPK
jgi:hypothetical protein